MYQHIEEFQKFLSEQNADAALLRLPENIVLFSQYWPLYGFSFIFIPASGKPYVICPKTEVVETDACDLDNVILFGDVLMEDGDPVESVISIFRRLAEEHNLKPNATIAVEMGEDVIAPTYVANKVRLASGDGARSLLTKGFNTTSFISVKEEIRDIRSIKNVSDIEKLQIINIVLTKSLDYFETLIERPGIRSVDVLAETQSFFIKLAADYGGRAARMFPQLSTGMQTLIAYADCMIPDSRVLGKGDLAMFEVGACIDGYWADLTRTACVGGYTGRKKEIFEIVKGAFEAGVKSACDGVTAGSIDKVCRDYINDAGYGEYYVHPTGHGTGFAHSENYPSLAPGCKHILRKNMAVCIEPGIYVPGIGGIREERSVLVGEKGGIVLGLPIEITREGVHQKV